MKGFQGSKGPIIVSVLNNSTVAGNVNMSNFQILINNEITSEDLSEFSKSLKSHYLSDYETLVKLEDDEEADSHKLPISDLFVDLQIVEDETQRIRNMRSKAENQTIFKTTNPLVSILKSSQSSATIPEKLDNCAIEESSEIHGNSETSPTPNVLSKFRKWMTSEPSSITGIRPAEGEYAERKEAPANSVAEQPNAFHIDDIFSEFVLSGRQMENSKEVLLLGDAGVGKSTLCHHLVHRWAKEEIWNDSQGNVQLYWLFYVRFKDVVGCERLGRERNIDRILYEVLWRFCGISESQSSSYWQALLKQGSENVLFVLDGYDEVASLNHDACEELMLLREKYSENFRVLTTSRPTAKISNTVDLVLRNNGFTEQMIPHYIDKYISWKSRDNTAHYHHLEWAKLYPWLQSQSYILAWCRIPLYLELICSLWMDNSTRFQGNNLVVSDLYHLMIGKLMKRFLKKFDPKKYDELTENVDIHRSVMTQPLCKQALQYLEELAAVGFVSQELLLSPKIFVELLGKFGVNFKTALTFFGRTGFVTFIGDMQEDLSKRSAYFLHLTFQEYLCARHFARKFLTNTFSSADQNFLAENKFNPRYMLVWIYVAGAIWRDDGEEFFQSVQLRQERIESALNRYFNELLNFPSDLFGVYEMELLFRCGEEANWPELQCTNKLLCQLGEWMCWACDQDKDTGDSALKFLSVLAVQCPSAMSKMCHKECKGLVQILLRDLFSRWTPQSTASARILLLLQVGEELHDQDLLKILPEVIKLDSLNVANSFVAFIKKHRRTVPMLIDCSLGYLLAKPTLVTTKIFSQFMLLQLQQESVDDNMWRSATLLVQNVLLFLACFNICGSEELSNFDCFLSRSISIFTIKCVNSIQNLKLIRNSWLTNELAFSNKHFAVVLLMNLQERTKSDEEATNSSIIEQLINDLRLLVHWQATKLCTSEMRKQYLQVVGYISPNSLDFLSASTLNHQDTADQNRLIDAGNSTIDFTSTVAPLEPRLDHIEGDRNSLQERNTTAQLNRVKSARTGFELKAALKGISIRHNNGVQLDLNVLLASILNKSWWLSLQRDIFICGQVFLIYLTIAITLIVFRQWMALIMFVGVIFVVEVVWQLCDFQVELRTKDEHFEFVTSFMFGVIIVMLLKYVAYLFLGLCGAITCLCSIRFAEKVIEKENQFMEDVVWVLHDIETMELTKLDYFPFILQNYPNYWFSPIWNDSSCLRKVLRKQLSIHRNAIWISRQGNLQWYWGRRLVIIPKKHARTLLADLRKIRYTFPISTRKQCSWYIAGAYHNCCTLWRRYCCCESDVQPKVIQHGGVVATLRQELEDSFEVFARARLININHNIDTNLRGNSSNELDSSSGHSLGSFRISNMSFDSQRMDETANNDTFISLDSPVVLDVY